MIFPLHALLLTAAKAQTDPAEEDFKALSKSPLPQLTLQSPYVNDYLQNENWYFGRDTVVDVNKAVRLTRDVQSQDGWLWSKFTRAKKSFVAEFEFSVSYKGALSGDGFAFWMTKESQRDGPVFGNMDYFTGVGIFFDTYANSRVRHTYPYIMGMNGDGKTHYDHDMDGNQQEAGGCVAEFRNKDKPTVVRITYIKGKDLKLDYKTSDSPFFKRCFSMTPQLPQYFNFGFTAMTGGVTSNHDIISFKAWDVMESYDEDEIAGSDDYGQSQQSYQNQNSYTRPPPNNQSNQGWGFFTWFFIILIIAVIAYAGWVYYNTTKQQSFKRF